MLKLCSSSCCCFLAATTIPQYHMVLHDFTQGNVSLLGNHILYEMKPRIYYETTNPNHSIWSQTTTLHVSVIANTFKKAGGIYLESKKILQVPPNSYLLSQSWIIFGFRYANLALGIGASLSRAHRTIVCGTLLCNISLLPGQLTRFFGARLVSSKNWE